MNFLLIKSQPVYQVFPSVGVLTNGNVFVAWEGPQAGNSMISMGGSSYLMEQPLGVSLALIKTQPIISTLHQLRVLTNGNVFVAWDGDQAGNFMISMGGSSYLMEQPLGVSLALIKSQPIISTIRQLQV